MSNNKMIQLILTLIILICPLGVLGQINYDNPPWDINCDSLYTQASMNRCSAKEASIADSVMMAFYNKNLELLNKEIESINETTESDNQQVNGFYLSPVKLKESQEKFIQYRESICEYERSKWSGGSITPLMVNAQYLSVTIERIKLLEKEYLWLMEN